MAGMIQLFPKKEQRKKFLVLVSSELQTAYQDGNGEKYVEVEDVTLQFDVQEQDMKAFHRILNTNGYLYTVQPMDGEDYD